MLPFMSGSFRCVRFDSSMYKAATFRQKYKFATNASCHFAVLLIRSHDSVHRDRCDRNTRTYERWLSFSVRADYLVLAFQCCHRTKLYSYRHIKK
jgi:hypothetical protein